MIPKKLTVMAPLFGALCRADPVMVMRREDWASGRTLPAVEAMVLDAPAMLLVALFREPLLLATVTIALAADVIMGAALPAVAAITLAAARI